MTSNRIHIFTGAYGSGKTEISMNFAVNLRKTHEKVAIVDLDIVNPYFRSREVAGPLNDLGVEVIFPCGELGTSDLPALSASILRVLQDDSYQVVMDVGGDNVGAVALGRFNPYFKQGYDMYFVINTLRPFTKDAEGIQEILIEVEHASRLKVTHLVANINLCGDTSVQDLISGYPAVKEVSEKLNLPVKYIAVEERLKESVDEGLFAEPIEFIKLYNRPEWLQKVW